MAKTCGNCCNSNKSIHYIPGNKWDRRECLCTLKDEYRDIEAPPCDQWVGDIKENRDEQS